MTVLEKTRLSILDNIKELAKKILKIILPLWMQAIIHRILVLTRLDWKYRFEMREAKRILRGLKNGKVTEVVIVYDKFVSPPNYGDYFFVVMFARFFISQDIIVKFIIVDDQYRSDWSSLNDVETNNLVTDFVQIANLLLDHRLATVEFLTSFQLNTRLRGNISSGVEVPFRENVFNRKPIYCHIPSTLNYLCSKFSLVHRDRFLLTIDEFVGKVNFKKPERPYITWHCRYSLQWGYERNTSEEEFIPIYAQLKALYPLHEIMIVSDDAGCEYFNKVADLHGVSCLFSKDYSDSMMGDGGLILGSDYCFILRGGGMTIFPTFSRLPHEIVQNLGTSIAWRHNRLTSWATDNQIFRLPDREENIWPTLSVMPKSDL